MSIILGVVRSMVFFIMRFDEQGVDLSINNKGKYMDDDS